MPRKAKDKELIEEKKIKKKSSTNKTKVASTKKTETKVTKTAKSTAKKATTKVKEPATKKASTSKNKVASTKKTETKVTKASKSTAKKATTKTKEPVVKKDSKAKKTTPRTKSTVKKTRTKSKKVVEKSIDVVEYYDLPYRYNETVVKVLAQTPNILFVYWDISDEDKQNYINKYGEFFFNDTKPVLVVHNDTLHYSFEIDINDYANSWYLEVNDSNCDYRVELGRRPINNYAKIDNYLYISSSNEMGSPNDHILFDSLNDNVYFRNIKTNIDFQKNISLSFLSKIGKLYNVKDFYKLMYKDENIDFERLNLRNMPSS